MPPSWCAPSASCAACRASACSSTGTIPAMYRAVSTTQVNAFLREIAGIKISLKDFSHADGVRRGAWNRCRGFHRRQAPAAAAGKYWKPCAPPADELSNTPAICRKSYVHDTIVTAFEDGILERFAATMKGLPLAIETRASFWRKW